jgi:hypothetical protein
MKTFKKSEEFKASDEFWLVLDVDNWRNLKDIIEMAAKEGVQSAVSNKCFELWLILHIIDISSLNKEEQALLLLNERVSIKHT